MKPKIKPIRLSTRQKPRLVVPPPKVMKDRKKEASKKACRKGSGYEIYT